MGESIGDMAIDDDPLVARSANKPKFSVSRALCFLTGSTRVLRYFYAGRRMFGSPRFLSLAVDASRVSRKKMLLTAMALPTNIAMWAPPQAPSAASCQWLACRLRAWAQGPNFGAPDFLRTKHRTSLCRTVLLDFSF